ncbi:MAG: hypothetical protein KJO95_12610 [Gammaproteobacteria bacterium]|nr:hypothetical protein [Gammaproteobacteria bacterium]MBU2678507.1 hypothetical protein [Gammaproteobacteria bacterium]NNC56893.1 hypothetical protein [Woeseiaceae bacterium]NNL52242.1 hypothetical protein [Woeseiaceae bacterium]
MDYRALIVIIWACLIGAAAIAAEEQRTRIKIAVDDDAAGQQTFQFDSQDAGFDLQSMAVGESRTVTDTSGSVADVRRTEDGFELDFKGETIKLDDLQGHDGRHVEHDVDMHFDGGDSDGVKVKKIKMIKTDGAEGVTVISGTEIDAETRKRIQDVLTSAGQDGEVHFIDGSDMNVEGHTQAHGKREIRIIEKEMDVTN